MLGQEGRAARSPRPYPLVMHLAGTGLLRRGPAGDSAGPAAGHPALDPALPRRSWESV